MMTTSALDHGRPQAWEGGGTCSPGNVVRCFCATNVVYKVPVDEAFMRYFEKML